MSKIDTYETWHRCRFQHLTWEDFIAIAPTLAEEICCCSYAIMRRKDFSNFSSPETLYYQRYMRKEIILCHEERTVLAIFLKHLFWEFWSSNKTTGFDTRGILHRILRDTGLGGYVDSNGFYKYSTTLENVCKLVVEKFPSFIKTLGRRLPRVYI